MTGSQWLKQHEKKRKNRWVSWFDLLNKSKHQTLAELKAFLIEKGLSDGTQATKKAYNTGMVRDIDGKERWNLKQYITLMQNDKKHKKQQAKRANAVVV